MQKSQVVLSSKAPRGEVVLMAFGKIVLCLLVFAQFVMPQKQAAKFNFWMANVS